MKVRFGNYKYIKNPEKDSLKVSPKSIVIFPKFCDAKNFEMHQ